MARVWDISELQKFIVLTLYPVFIEIYIPVSIFLDFYILLRI